MASVRAFADRCTAEWSGLHILINNAGVMLTTVRVPALAPGAGSRLSPVSCLPYLQRQENAQGMELTLATNYYGPFLLIHSLLPLLKATASVRLAGPGPEARSVTLAHPIARRTTMRPT